jgi:uncharacterized protein YukE
MTGSDAAQMVADLRSAGEAVRGKGWVAPGLGVPGAPLGLLGSSLNPLSGLAAAGLGWFMPLVSFLGEPLTQLQGGDGASVSSGAGDFAGAGRDLGGVADAYRESTSAQTSGWSGQAAGEYRDAGARHADGVAGLGAASSTTGDAIIGAGQVVAQAIAEVTELIAEAVAQIVPIMTQAMARAGETFGQSVVEAIPPCVGIAVEYAMRIAAKLAALLASGENLLKLVQGGMAVVELINQALTSISQQSITGDVSAGQDTAQASATGLVSPGSLAVAGNGQSPAPMSTTGEPAMSGGTVAPQATHSWTPPASPATYSSSILPPSHGAVSDTARPAGYVGGGGPAANSAPGETGRGPAAGAGRRGETATQETRQRD